MKGFNCVLFFFITLQAGIGQFQSNIDDILSESDSQSASFGISVRGADGGLLYQYNGSTRLIPASTLKLITTLSAIEILGKAFQYSTDITYHGELLEDGTLKGDLVVLGSGDPSLGSHELSERDDLTFVLNHIGKVVEEKGIKCIDGNIIVNDGIFDRNAIHPSWSWDDITNYYASGAWGFNIHDNYYYLSFSRSNQSNQPTQEAKISPQVPDLSMENRVTTGPLNSGDNAYIYGNPYSTRRYVEGTIPPGKGEFTIKGALPNPPLFGAYQLRKYLESIGINSMGYGVSQSQSPGKVDVSKIVSPVLSDLVASANARSDNMYCEAFFKKLGSLNDELGTYENGVGAIRDHLAQLELPMEQIHIEDGSGLSARNRISPNFMTAFLQAKVARLGIMDLKNLIPRVGQEGSVRNFLKGYPCQQSAWLKSGSINNVLAYSGLLELKSGHIVSISIMANGHTSNRQLRGQIEKIIETIYQKL